MELRVLRYFQAVVKEKNISRAAQRLHVSQPAISRQLKSLEDELGITLFERGSRNIELTSSGEYFAEQVNQILSLTDKTLKNIHEDQDIAGQLVIGSAEASSFINVAESLNALRQTYPRIKANIISTNADEIRANLKSGFYDFGVVMEPSDKSDYDFLTLPGDSRWGLLVPEDSEIAKKDHLALSDLDGQNILISRQKGMLDLLQSWYGNSQQKFNIVATYNLLYNASLLVLAGVGYALCLDGIINTKDSGLVFVRIEPKLTSGASLVWEKGLRQSDAASAFLRQINLDLDN
jgi:DNA-binding transcriptional LysR family regulator